MKYPGILLLLFPIYLCGQSIDWSIDLKKELNKINWLRQANDGTLIASGDKGIIGINNGTGEISWNNQHLKAVDISTVQMVDPLPYIMMKATTMLGKQSTVMVQSNTGEVITNSGQEDFTVMNYYLLAETGSIIFELKENKQYVVALYDISAGTMKWRVSVGKAKKGLKGLIKGQSSFLSQYPRIINKTVIINYKKNVMGIDMDSGNVEWTNEYDDEPKAAIKAGHNVIIGVKKAIYVLDPGDGSQKNNEIKLRDELTGCQPSDNGYYVMNEKGFNILDTKDYTISWEKPDKIDESHQVYNTQHGYVSVTRYEENGGVALMGSDGKKKWKKDISGRPIFVFPTSKGVFYISSEKANLMGYEKGDKVLKKDIKISDTYAVAFDESVDNIVIYSDKKLSTYNLSSGIQELLAEDVKLQKFDSDKDWLNLEVRDNGYFLYSSKNNAFIQKNGKVVYNNYYKPVKTSGWMAVAKDIGKGYGVDADALSADMQSMNGLMNGAIMQGDKSTSSRKSSEAILTVTQEDNVLYQASMTRFDATSETKDHVYVYTNSGSGNELYKIQKESGAIAKKFTFKDKDPTYVVDEYDKRLYYLEGTSLKSTSLE